MTRTFERCPGCGAITWEGEAPSHRHRPPCPHEGVSDFEAPTFTPLDVPRNPSPRVAPETVTASQIGPVTRESGPDLTPLPQDNPTRKESA